MSPLVSYKHVMMTGDDDDDVAISSRTTAAAFYFGPIVLNTNGIVQVGKRCQAMHHACLLH